jgi:hypothetical protein
MEFATAGLVVAAVLIFVVLPLVRRGGPVRDVAEPSTATAERRAAIYRELLEVELDHHVGKVADEDFREQSDALLARAAALITEEDAQASANDELEQEIAAMRETLQSPAPTAPGEPRP